MDLTLLPEPIFIDIMKYLSPDDLLSCCLVNISWRNAVNSNDIWRYICKHFVITVTGNELDHIPAQVSKCESLYSAPNFEPLCKWRKTFMRWMKLNDNWRKGRYKCSTLDEEISTFCPVECDDSIALILNDDLREISVWNIKHMPYHQEDIKFLLHHVCSDFVKLCNNYLVIVQCNLLQVFRSTDNGFTLHFKCIFDKDESHVNLLPNDNITEWYCSNINLYPCDLMLRCGQNGSKFIGLILDSDFNKNVLHIWDLDKNIKTAEAPMPQSSNSVSDINFSMTEDHVYLMITNYDAGHCNSFCVYDLKEYKFIDFKFHFNRGIAAFIVNKNLIAAIDGGLRQVNVWKNNDSHNVVECNYEIDLKCFNVESPYLLIGGKNLPKSSQITVSVYHLKYFKCIFTTKVSLAIDFISLIQNKFLIIDCISSYRFISIVDIIKHCHLYVIENCDCMFINSFHSKLVTRADNKLNVISFW